MATHKHIDAICTLIVLLTVLLTVLFCSRSLGIAAQSEESADAVFTEQDLAGVWDTAGATKIVLSDQGSTVSGNGAYALGSDIHILYAGKYLISGAASNGQILIEADGDDRVWLMLNGVSVHCEDDAALRIEQAEKVFLTLKDGTENSFTTGASYREEAVTAKVDGAIYSRDDLTVNGTGALSVTTAYQHGIVCNDNLIVTGGDIRVDAVQDGIHANDSVRIKDATITVSAGDDGITVSNDTETAYFYMESGELSIPSCYEGIEASDVTVAGGRLTVTPTDDGINACGYTEDAAIRITGGEVKIVNETGRDADGLDSNRDILISGGRLFVSVNGNGGNCALDYGSENGGVCRIDGGIVLACGGSSMVEGMDPTSAQGFLMYTASAQAGAAVTVTDRTGEPLLSETVPCGFTSIVVSTPEMKVGDTYTVQTGDTERTMTADNSSQIGGFGGQGGMAPNGNTAPPALQNGQNGFRPNFGQGGTPPDMPQNGTGDNRFQNGNGGAPFNGGAQTPADQNGEMASDSSAEETARTPTANELILLGISAAVLLLGTSFAFFFRRRGSF